MKRILSIALILTVAQAAFAAEHFHWFVPDGDHAGAEILYARMGNAFRGEYIDPGFQEKCSVPIVGTIDAEGNIKGVGAILNDGNIYAKLTGKITGDTLEVTWLPSPGVASELREMKMERQEFTSETVEAQRKHPDAFYNSLFLELMLATSDSQPLRRAIPFKPTKVTTTPTHYGYRVGEFENQYIYVSPVEGEEGKVRYHLHIERSGQFDIEKNIEGTATLQGESFRVKDKDYEFEVSVYNGFITIRTVAGSLDLSDVKGIDDDFKLKADGVYPAPMAMNFYVEKKSAEQGAKDIKEKIVKEVLALPEMKFKKAAAIIDSEPTDEQPYYTVKGGTDTDTHFATSHWFRVYTTPAFEIKYYDVVSDTEMTLAEHRGETPDSPILTFHAYVKLAPKQPAEGIALLIDDVLMIRGDDKEKLKQFGIDPENVTNDYAIHNAKKEWRPGEIMPSGDAQVEPEFKIMTFDKEGSPKFHDASLTEFRKHLEGKDDGILAKVTASRNGPGYMVVSVKEQYVP